MLSFESLPNGRSYFSNPRIANSKDLVIEEDKKKNTFISNPDFAWYRKKLNFFVRLSLGAVHQLP